MISYLFILFCFGIIFGSFSTVLIERWHSGKWGILMGRSECPNCHHILWIRDLVPIFSYVFNYWKCAHCKKNISWFYPISEILMGGIFVLIGYSGINIGLDPIWLKMLLLLIFGFVTGVYILYDIKYMEIPDQIMVPSILILILIPFFSLLFIWFEKFSFHTFNLSIFDRLYWTWMLYTFFYLQILIPWGYYLIKNKDWKNFGMILLGYITFPFTIIIDFFKTKKNDETIDIPVWIGWGDLRIAIFIWLTLGTIHGLTSFAIAYIIGSIVGIFLIIINNIKWKKMESQIPFWPFLWIWWLLSILYYPYIDIYFNIYLY